jgi:hypothetical protein
MNKSAEGIFNSYVKHQKQAKQKHYRREICGSHSGFKLVMYYGI